MTGVNRDRSLTALKTHILCWSYKTNLAVFA